MRASVISIRRHNAKKRIIVDEYNTNKASKKDVFTDTNGRDKVNITQFNTNINDRNNYTFIKSITDSIKRSVTQIVSYSFFQSDVSKMNPDANNNIAHSEEENEILDPLLKVAIPSSYYNEKLCLIKDIPNEDTPSPREVRAILKKKKSVFRRCKSTLLLKNSQCVREDIVTFLKFIEKDPIITLFLKRDICRRYADKYLIAMVLVYFVRAKVTPETFNREKFFAALYLAHDMEEDCEEMKYEFFPFALGRKWRETYKYLLTIRDDFFFAMDCRAVVSKKSCEQVMNMIPDHWLWERERPQYHAHVSGYLEELELEITQPRGPYRSPVWCRPCLERECAESENSYIIFSSVSDVSLDSDEQEKENLKKEEKENLGKDSGFESFLLTKSTEKRDTHLMPRVVLTPLPHLYK